MPLLLTTPLNPGDIDTTSYNEVKITQMLWDTEQGLIRVKCQYGNTVDGNWIAGKDFRGVTRENPEYHFIQGEPYVTLLGSTTSGTDLVLYLEIRDALYQWLLDNNKYSGTVI